MFLSCIWHLLEIQMCLIFGIYHFPMTMFYVCVCMTNLDSILKSRDITSPTKVRLPSCPIPRNPMDCSPLGFSLHGILQATILEWIAMLFSRGSFQLRVRTWVSCIAGRFFKSEPPGKPKEWKSHQYSGHNIKMEEKTPGIHFQSGMCPCSDKMTISEWRRRGAGNWEKRNPF